MSEVDHQKGTSLAVWVLAAFGAVAIHAGCVALAFEYLQSDDLDEATGAIAIEVGIERTSPRLEPSDLPPGPDADASVASPAVVEQKAVVERTELPKAVPTETDDPDRLVTPNDVKKPKDDDPEMPTVQATPSIESVASEATAMPSSETAPEAPRSVAPAVGPGESTQRVRMTWQKELAAHLDRHKRYPADRSRQPAEIVVRFELDRTGHVISASIMRGSGDTSFDEAALAMMRRADPVPPPPPRVADEGLTFTMPVIFRVKGQK
jgi:periplasmic protein TonB